MFSLKSTKMVNNLCRTKGVMIHFDNNINKKGLTIIIFKIIDDLKTNKNLDSFQ